MAMCTCVETIQKTFIGVKKQTNKIDDCSFDMDDFLDRINSIKKPVENVTCDILKLVELVRVHFIELNAEDSALLLKDFIKTRQKMYEVYAKLRKSSLYVGMKNAVKEFRHSADLYSEMCEDLQKFNIDLSKDSDYQNLTKRLNAIA